LNEADNSGFQHFSSLRNPLTIFEALKLNLHCRFQKIQMNFFRCAITMSAKTAKIRFDQSRSGVNTSGEEGVCVPVARKELGPVITAAGVPGSCRLSLHLAD